MSEQQDPETTATKSQSARQTLSPRWRSILLASPAILFLGSVLFVFACGPFARLIPLRVVEILLPLYMFIGVLFALFGPFFGSYALLKALNPKKIVNPLYLILIWLGVLVVNLFVVFAMCMMAMPLLSK